jgi:peptidoglycan hydrolase-like protein with peptidoglycan-binding domain
MTRILVAALLATALAAPAAMAQTAGANGTNGMTGANTTNGANNGAAAANGTNGTANQRVTNESAGGMGAIITVSPSGVREVQQALNRLGYAAGVINGVWSQATAQAMIHFQQAHGLEPTGNMNLSSIAALGLWNNLIGDPLGNNHKALAGNSAAPPPRGGKNASNVGGSALPSQRITNEQPGGGSAGTTGAGNGGTNGTAGGSANR